MDIMQTNNLLPALCMKKPSRSSGYMRKAPRDYTGSVIIGVPSKRSIMILGKTINIFVPSNL